MKKILRKLLALNLTVIMLLAMIVPVMAGGNGLYWFDVLDKDEGPGYYKVTSSLPEDFKVYEAFRMGYWVSCEMTGGSIFIKAGSSSRGDELPPMPNAYTPATATTGGENVYYLDTNADNRAGSYPDDKLYVGFEWSSDQYYLADNKVTYERIEPTLNNINFAAAPKGAYVYRSDVEFTYADNNTDSSDANESYVIYRGRTPIQKTFLEGKGWLYVLEANTDYYVVKNNGLFEGVTPINPFTDVAEGQYYYNPVLWAVKKGITTGTSATTFSPTKACSRAEVVTFLWRASGSPAPKTSTNPFTDVAAGGWYTDAVLWAVGEGITNGTSATTFSPDKVCTRAEVVTFLKRAVAPVTEVVPDAEDDKKVESESFSGYSNSNPAKLGALKAEGTGYKFDSTSGQLMPVFDSITAYDQHGNALSDTVNTYGFYSKPSLYRDDKITSAPEIGQKYYSGFTIDLDNIGGWEFTTEDIEISIPGFDCKVYSAMEREMGSYMSIIYEAVAVETKPVEPVEPVEPAEPAFADVPAGQWYTDAVLWAVENGITTGTGGNNFSPNVTCDRGQIVTFLYRAVKK